MNLAISESRVWTLKNGHWSGIGESNDQFDGLGRMAKREEDGP